MSDYEELEQFYGKHRSYSDLKKSGGVFGSSTYIVKSSSGDTGTFERLKKAVEWVQQEVGRHKSRMFLPHHGSVFVNSGSPVFG